MATETIFLLINNGYYSAFGNLRTLLDSFGIDDMKTYNKVMYRIRKNNCTQFEGMTIKRLSVIRGAINR